MLLLKKKIVSVLVALGVVTSSTVPVLASPNGSGLNSQLKQQQSELQQNKNSLGKLQDKREEIEENIEMLDFDIEELMGTIEDNKAKIAMTQEQIKAAEKEVEKAEVDLQAEKDLFNERMRAMYISGVDGYLNILLEAKGFNDFLSRVEDVKNIAEADQKIIDELNAKKAAITEKKKALDSKNESLLALKAQNEQKLDKLSETKKEQSALIADLKSQEKQYSAEIQKSQDKINSITNRLKELRTKAIPAVTKTSAKSSNRVASSYSRGGSGITVTGSLGNVSSSSIVGYAYKFEGTPYVWGGTSPVPGFDCSGFVQYVYRHFGVSLPRVAASQATVGTPVAKGDLQPGDLVFFKKGGRAVHHVGIYVGNGCYIHSPKTGDVVKVSDLSRRSDYYSARRVR